MKRKSILLVILATFLLLLGAGFYLKNRPVALNTERFVQSTRPTLFFHGFGSSSNAERHMANAAKEAGVTHTIIEANVAEDGKVSLNGEIPKGAINPIVLVNYENNSDPDTQKVATYAYQVVKALQERYQITEMNMVGHSYGNMSIMYYLLYHGQDTSLPKLIKQVDIAGHFNGILGMNEPENVTLAADGKPSAMDDRYQRLLGVRETYPANQIDVLNIYGDTGDGTDQSVRNISSQSLRYLVANRAKSYREVKIDGKDGQHSQLHETSKVDQVMIPFIWGK
ncbi:alpha/beta hydrolase [Streptococcus sp. DD13]|uniref:alpha/beta hydrolase n=1 Tax=Streptococcus sp. DD13 TaxID=1777881 RepID=UPI000832610D|nr:alpha/beta hydrolase [Streptococcus sp. DD13]